MQVLRHTALRYETPIQPALLGPTSGPALGTWMILLKQFNDPQFVRNTQVGMNPSPTLRSPLRSPRTGAMFATQDAISPFTNNTFGPIVIRLNFGPEVIRAATILLSEGERQRAGRFAFDRDRRRFTVARAALRELLTSRLGTWPESIELAYGTRDKPAIALEYSHADLHCNDVGVDALSRHREIGVDVEAVQVMPDGDDIATCFFSIRESGTSRGLGPQVKTLAFVSYWSYKEAYIKALGRGPYDPLDSFDVSLLPCELGQMLWLGKISGDDCGRELCTFAPPRGYVVAVAIGRPTRQSDATPSVSRSGCFAAVS